MTDLLFMNDAYLREATGTVLAHSEGGISLDATLFYAQGGGQPGDSGQISWEGGTARVANCVKGEGGPRLILEEGAALPPVGAMVMQTLDWDRRFAHMQVHTALHLLSVVIPLPVSGGAITDVKGRLDFDMPEPVLREEVEAALNELIQRDLPVSETWISDEELAANPGLVKTMSVKPPVGAGRVRLVRIGEGDAQIDLQPCGGTHVRRTSEIGPVRIGKVEKKGKQNRRVNVLLGAA